MKRLFNVLAFTLLAAFASAQNTVVKNGQLTGSGQVPTGATLTINGTLAIGGGGSVTGLPTTDATLTAIAGLTTSANKITLWTGTDTASVIDFTALTQTFAGYTTAAQYRNAIFPGSAATGDLITYESSAWVRKAIGTAGDVATVQGDGTWDWAPPTIGGDFSSDTATSVDGQVMLFSGTLGKTGKRATQTGIATLTSGVLGATTAPTGDLVGTTATQALTNKTLTSPIIATISNTGTLTLPTATDTLVGRATTDTLTNKTLTSPTLTTPIVSGAITLPDGVTQTFNPNATNAGINVGAHAGDPSAPADGDLWYDTSSNELTARINGANVALGAGGGGGGSGLFVGRTAKTGAYTVVAGDQGYLIDCTTGTFTISLTAAATLGSGFYVAVYNNSATNGTITIDPNASETIRDHSSAATTKALFRGEGVIIVCDGSNFAIVAQTRQVGGIAQQGTNAAPTIFSSGSSGTGIYFPDSGFSIGFTASGTAQGKFTSNGLEILNTGAPSSTVTGSIRNAGGIGNAGVIYTQVPTESAPAGASINANRSNITYTNTAATSQASFTLPSAAANLIFSFVVADADGLRVTAASGDTIRIAGTVSGAAGYVESATIGNTLTLVAINATEWIATASHGTWTFSP